MFVWVRFPLQSQLAFCKKAIINLNFKTMKNYILVKNKEEIFKRNQQIKIELPSNK